MNDAPTVVIDTSLDEKDIAAQEQFRKLEDDDNQQTFSNIQYALRSLRQLEEEEQNDLKKKKVIIMSVEEEEQLITQINEIRDRIKRGDTVAQQKGSSTGGGASHYNEEYKSSINSETGIQELQLHFRSVDGVTHQSQIQTTANFNTKQSSVTERTANQQQTVQKPPLYSLTFAHPHEVEQDIDKNPLAGLSQKQAFHSIDQNAPTNCIITDGPNIYEKKKQRFEKIQKMRGAGQGA